MTEFDAIAAIGLGTADDCPHESTQIAQTKSDPIPLHLQTINCRKALASCKKASNSRWVGKDNGPSVREKM